MPVAIAAPAEEPTPVRVRWGRVALFYAIALSIAIVISLVVARGGQLVGNGALQMLVAVIYMPSPLIAALILERIDGRGYMITRVFQGFRTRIARLLKVGVAFWLSFLVLSVGAAFLLGNLLAVPGIGALPTDGDMFLTGLKSILPPGVELTAEQTALLPSWWVVYVQTIVGGIVAGMTINALFAFGEEYGWRGVLQDELAPLGHLKANVLIGLLWGLWHAPLIIMTGYNYPGQPIWGSIMMTAALIPFSFLQYQARRITGSILGPAVIHGIFNACAGLFLFSVGRNALVGAPLGVLGVVVLTALAVAAWSVKVEYLPVPGSPVDERAALAGD